MAIAEEIGGYGGAGFGLGLGYGGFGYDDAFGYGDAGYGYPAYGYGYGDGDPTYSGGVQYGEPLRTGRSAAVGGGVCSTPVRSCQLSEPTAVGTPCSCVSRKGTANGNVTP